MSSNSKIEWTDATWNPVTGCTKVSPGCANCYIERTPPFRIGHRKFDAKGTTGVVLHPDRLKEPLHWKKPRRVFVNSLSDLFHEDVPDGYIANIWRIMGQSPRHTFQILTKRPQRMLQFMRKWSDVDYHDVEFHDARGPEAVRKAHKDGRAQLFADMIESWGAPPKGAAYPTYDWMQGIKYWPEALPNVWLGVSVENQHFADERIPLLLQTPAAVRFISAEPLLDRVDLTAVMQQIDALRCIIPKHLDWVIVGGESGPGARAMFPTWARLLRDQCVAARVPFFFKQWGEHKIVAEFESGGIATARIGKKAAGRRLDGREWNEFPK